jgi:hypothetical protein
MLQRNFPSYVQSGRARAFFFCVVALHAKNFSFFMKRKTDGTKETNAKELLWAFYSYIVIPLGYSGPQFDCSNGGWLTQLPNYGRKIESPYGPRPISDPSLLLHRLGSRRASSLPRRPQRSRRPLLASFRAGPVTDGPSAPASRRARAAAYLPRPPPVCYSSRPSPARKTRITEAAVRCAASATTD